MEVLLLPMTMQVVFGFKYARHTRLEPHQDDNEEEGGLHITNPIPIPIPFEQRDSL